MLIRDAVLLMIVININDCNGFFFKSYGPLNEHLTTLQTMHRQNKIYRFPRLNSLMKFFHAKFGHFSFIIDYSDYTFRLLMITYHFPIEKQKCSSPFIGSPLEKTKQKSNPQVDG